MLKVTVKGDFTNTSRYLEKMNHKEFMSKIMTYADMGTNALEKYTPHDTGYTAQSWYSEIEETNDSLTIRWNNSHINKGVPIAVFCNMDTERELAVMFGVEIILTRHYSQFLTIY